MARGEFSPDRLRGHRNGRGLTRAEVGTAIGRSAGTIASYEDGRSLPTAPALVRLAQVYRVSIDDFYARFDDQIEDYVDAVAQHCKPLTDAEIATVATVLRRIDRRLIAKSGVA